MRNTEATLRSTAGWLLLAIGTSFATVAHAGQGVWTSGGPNGGFVVSLAIDPGNSATLYAGAWAGLFKSIDSGGTWTALLDLRVGALTIDPGNPSTLYAATGGGVFKSADRGITWTNKGLADVEVVAVAIDPLTPATLYAGTGRGVFKSTDSGGTWAAAQTDPLTYLGVSALAIDPVTPSTLYAGSWEGGVFKSTDSGATWAFAGVVANTGGVSVQALGIDPVTPSTLYAGTDVGGVFKSTDSGGTWTSANTGLLNTGVTALAINPSNPATLYAGTYGGVFRSADSGATWAAVNAGLPGLPVWALALDPAGATTLYAGLAPSDTVPGDGNVWQSTPPTTSTTVLLPTSAHSAGRGGAFYTTDLLVSNLGEYAASTTLKFLGNDSDGSSGPELTFSLDPGESKTFVDVLGSVFGATNDFGALRVASNASSLDVVSVTSSPGFGGTFGSTIPAVPFSDLIPAGSSRSILYVREGDGFRSNLVLASGANVSTAVDAALVSSSGATLATKTYSVPPNGMTQVDRVVRDMGVSAAVTGARLVLSSSTAGALFTGVASVIDETTNDPTAVLVQPASVSGSAPHVWLLPASAHASGVNGAFYTTNLAVANTGAVPASFTMKFLGHDQDGSGGPEQTFTLEANRSVIYFDVLGAVFSQTSNFGAIRITSDTPSLNILSVTSTPGFGGTFGQALRAVPSAELVCSDSSRSILSVREGDGFRSNLVLASNATVPTIVDVTLVSQAGVTLATRSYSVPPNGMTQINRVVRDLGVSGAISSARLVLSSSTPGAAFTGFASVIDEVTNDPTAVEAR